MASNVSIPLGGLRDLIRVIVAEERPSVVGRQGAQGFQGVGTQGAQGFQGATGASNLTASTTTDLTGYLTGNGSNLSATSTLPATDLTGTLDDGRLSSNVPLKNATNTFSQLNTFSNGISVGANGISTSVLHDLSLSPGTGYVLLGGTLECGNIASETINIAATGGELVLSASDKIIGQTFEADSVYTTDYRVDSTTSLAGVSSLNQYFPIHDRSGVLLGYILLYTGTPN